MDLSLTTLVASLAGKRILVVGDVMLDVYVWGDVSRISPEAPVPVVQIGRRTFLPGGAANTAVNVVGLGGRAALGGVVGDDGTAAALRDGLAGRRVSTGGLLVDAGRVTTAKTRVIAQGKQVVRLDEEHPAPLPAELEERLLAWAGREMEAVDACLLSDYGKGVVSEGFARRFLELARRAGRPTVVDPKGTDFTRFRGATVVKPNLAEARRSCGADGDGGLAPAEAGRRLVETLGGGAVLVTCGADGMVLCRAGARPLAFPSAARAVFDVTGAGDTVAAVMALALAAGAGLEEAASLANRAAGVVVGKVGTAAVTAEELCPG